MQGATFHALCCSVIPKATSPENIKANFDAMSFELTPEHFERLSSLDYQALPHHNLTAMLPEGWKLQHRAALHACCDSSYREDMQINPATTSMSYNVLSWLQARYVVGDFVLNPEHGPYRTLDQLWDGELGKAEGPHVR